MVLSLIRLQTSLQHQTLLILSKDMQTISCDCPVLVVFPENWLHLTSERYDGYEHGPCPVSATGCHGCIQSSPGRPFSDSRAGGGTAS